MHIVFCIDDNPRFLCLLKVAVRSLREQMGQDVPCLCVYAGEKTSVLEALAAENIPVSRYKPILSKDLIPQQFHGCIGCFLRLELALVPELAGDDYVLYCDSDVLFAQDISPLLEVRPPYMAMATEYSAPFYHDHEQLQYTWRENTYTVPMPFPIWTYSSGVVVFNLQRLRKYDYIHNFLAFCIQNIDVIGNLDQSLLNYFFGKRITKLEAKWNRPPYQPDVYTNGAIIHFHGPKPWDVARPCWADLRINHYASMSQKWLSYLREDEKKDVDIWRQLDIDTYASSKE